eukprot:184564-Chlamydomonas_euryale.AAC.4
MEPQPKGNVLQSILLQLQQRFDLNAKAWHSTQRCMPRIRSPLNTVPGFHTAGPVACGASEAAVLPGPRARLRECWPTTPGGEELAWQAERVDWPAERGRLHTGATVHTFRSCQAASE